MTESFHPEFLSALLDGQLSPEQKAAVEAHLASHPHDAQTLEDLRNLRGQLQGLPRLSAPSNLQKSILRQIRTSELASPALPVPSAGQSFANTAWLVACAASLIGLILIGVFYRPNRNDATQVAQTPTSKATENTRDFEAAPSPSGRDEAPEHTGDVAKDERTDEPAPPANDFDPSSAEAGNPKLGITEPSIAAKAESAGIARTERDSEEMPGAKGPPGFAGGQGGGVSESSGAVERALSDAQNSILAEQPTSPMVAAEGLGELGRNDIAVEPCPSLDQLIVVQIPPGQSADAWIASVFQRAEVQVDLDEPKSFDEHMRQRKQLPVPDADGNLLETEQKSDSDAIAKSSERQDDFQSREFRLDEPATAYMIDAEVQQIRQILDRLEGTSVVGFPSPSQPGAGEILEKKTEPKAFPSNAAIARRLPSQISPLGQSNELEKSDSIADPAAAKEATQSQRVINALGLNDKSPTARQRVLFVFHSAPLAPVAPAGQPDSSAAPNQK